MSKHPVIYPGAKVRLSHWDESVGFVTVLALHDGEWFWGTSTSFAEYPHTYTISDAWVPFVEPPPPCPEIGLPWAVVDHYGGVTRWRTPQQAHENGEQITGGGWVIELKREDAVYVPPKDGAS